MSQYNADEIADRSIDHPNRRTQEEDDRAYVCANCATPIDASEWHPVVARTDGATTVYLFCDIDCKVGWVEAEDRA